MVILRSGEPKGERYLQRLEARHLRLIPVAVEARARRVVAEIARHGDRALVAYVRRFDLKGRPKGDLRLRGTVEGGPQVGEEFTAAVEVALASLQTFHAAHATTGFTLEQDGGELALRVRAVDSVGVCVADGGRGGLAGLLAAVVPARVAGVPRIAVAVPPRAFVASPQLRYLLERLELREIYLMGGAHAVAALAFGTDSVAPVDVIVGGRGRLVAAAKRAVWGAVGCDAPAAPPELVVVADARAEAEIAAADLVAAAEEDEDTLAVLLTPSQALAAKVERRVAARVRTLAKSPARAALKERGAIVVTPDLNAAVDAVNRIAPQRVELLLDEPLRVLDGIERAGQVLLGAWSAASLAEAAGVGSAAPAGGAARFASPLGVEAFVRRTAVARIAAHRYHALSRSALALAPAALAAEALRAGRRGKV